MARADADAALAIVRAREATTADEVALARSQEALARMVSDREAHLADQDAKREAWHGQTAQMRADATEARTELAKRGQLTDPETEATEPGTRAPDASPALDQASASAEQAQQEHDAAQQADAAQVDREQAAHWQAQADAERSAAWQPGRHQAEADTAAEASTEPEYSYDDR
jgi:hypothetical protein